ncbi:MAG: PUA domain-containing protein [Candidatus Woesearchaeota archaeon]
MNLKRLSNKELRELSKEVSQYGFVLRKGNEVYSALVENRKVIVLNKRIGFFYFKERILPSLHILLENQNILNSMKKIIIDRGAIAHIINRADVMRPGILSYSPDLNKDEIAVVVEEQNMKPIAFTQSLFKSEEISALKSGVVAKNIHCYGDSIWNFKI